MNKFLKRSSVSLDESIWQENIESYLQSKYGIQGWREGKHNTAETISNATPIEMQWKSLQTKLLSKYLFINNGYLNDY